MKKEIIYGFHVIESGIMKNAITHVWLEKGHRNQRAESLINLMEKKNIPYDFVVREYINHRTTDEKHQGVIAEYENTMTNLRLDEIIQKENVFLLLLDGIQDPHNLGAILRSANAAGVDAVIATKDKSVSLTPAVRKVASGAAEATPFFQVSNLAETIKKLKKEGVWCTGTTGDANQSLYEANLTGKMAIVMGSEEKGLRRLTKESCDFLIKIPMNGTVESLNVSVATGIVLFEALRQSKA